MSDYLENQYRTIKSCLKEIEKHLEFIKIYQQTVDTAKDSTPEEKYEGNVINFEKEKEQKHGR